ncbi:hypothetical protein CUU95_15575 [Vreelandella alkaliphila]|uniref:hypothetical protein n=1 Tax=Vreelandella alkaliphila TaxID=272774 RepID=UPI000EA0B91E|nr:hypothetical protein [Halomonas alkaliphila]AYF35152.1 hypothetical protein CUU95_15575 [Halomonas alkaliphila]
MKIPEKPTHQEVDKALNEVILKPFCEFPLVSASDWSVLVCAIFTAVQRPVLPTAPGFVLSATTAGTGKTTAALAIGALCGGSVPNIWPHLPGEGSEETRKRLVTALLTGVDVIVWDNVFGVFGNPSLDAFLTSATFTDRLLGQSAQVSLPNRALFLVTGNNFIAKGDTNRRLIVCHMDPGVEFAYKRRFDLDPVSYCLHHRQSIVSAVLLILRAFRQSNAAPKSGRLASFEDWDDMIRQPVAWLADRYDWLTDPMDAIDASQAVDPEKEAHAALMRALHSLFDARVFTSRDVLSAYREYDKRREYEPEDCMEPHLMQARRELSECLEDLAPGKLTARSIGRIMSFREGRIVDGYRLKPLPSTREKRWSVEVIQ